MDNTFSAHIGEEIFSHCQGHKLTPLNNSHQDYSLFPEGAKKVGKAINSAGSWAGGQQLTDVIAHTITTRFSKGLGKRY